MSPRLVILGVGTVVVLAGAIWLASAFESGNLGKPKSPKAEGLVVDLKSPERDDYIVICNEGAFQDAFARFRNYVKITTPPLAAPGGPALLTLGDVDVPSELQKPKRVMVEFLKRHSPKRVVLMAHAECLIDDSIGAWFDDPGGVRTRQYAQLARARDVLREWLPTATVEIFYGEKYSHNQMRFFPVSDDSLHAAAEFVATQVDSLLY